MMDMNKNGKFFTDDEREERINKYFKHLKKITKDVDKERKSVIIPLLENIAFCIVQLEELRAYIKQNGYFEYYQNGDNQFGYKKSIATDLISQVSKNYSTFLGRLKEYIPDANLKDDELDKFQRENGIKK